MKVAIMQPYFLPYLGYFQLVSAVDLFVVYDRIKYTKKGWINRNRMLVEGRDEMFSLPLRSASDALPVCEREIAADFDPEKLLNRFREAYRAAPFFEPTFALVQQIARYPERNLFSFIHHSIAAVCDAIGIRTRIAVSSEIGDDPALKAQERVIAICRALGASTYVNPPGGAALYSNDPFEAAGLELAFLQPHPFEYAQRGDPFVPWLSIVDVMMFNAPDVVRERVASGYDLVAAS